MRQSFKPLLHNYTCFLFEEQINQSEQEFIDFFFFFFFYTVEIDRIRACVSKHGLYPFQSLIHLVICDWNISIDCNCLSKKKKVVSNWLKYIFIFKQIFHAAVLIELLLCPRHTQKYFNSSFFRFILLYEVSVQLLLGEIIPALLFCLFSVIQQKLGSQDFAWLTSVGICEHLSRPLYVRGSWYKAISPGSDWYGCTLENVHSLESSK